VALRHMRTSYGNGFSERREPFFSSKLDTSGSYISDAIDLRVTQP
jgi:hypothetical protein